MKTIDPTLASHLAGTVTTLATIWKITRMDGISFYFTDHDADIVYAGDTYRAENGYSRTAVQNDSSLSVDNLDIMGVFDSAEITDEDIRAGLFDYAEIRIAVVNWADLTQGELKVRRGRIGECLLTPQGWFKAEMRGLTQNLAQNIGEVYQAECRADLGDSRCTVPIRPPLRQDSTAYAAGAVVRVPTDVGVLTTISGEPTQDAYEDRVYRCTTPGTTDAAPPTFDTTVGNTTADGTVVWTAEDSYTRMASVEHVVAQDQFSLVLTEPRAVDDWFNGGGLVFETGDNAGFAIEVRDWGEQHYATGTIAVTSWPGNNTTLTIGTKVYTFQNTLTNVDGHIKTATSEAALVIAQRIEAAINGTGMTPGTDYAAATTPHPVVSASLDGTTVVLTAKFAGTAGNLTCSDTTTATTPTNVTGGSGGLQLFLDAPFPIAAGDKVRIYPGCDKRAATCSARFANILNFRGEPFVPGVDEIGNYPDAN